MAEKESKTKVRQPSAEEKRRAYILDLKARAGHDFEDSEAASIEVQVAHKERTAKQDVIVSQ